MSQSDTYNFSDEIREINDLIDAEHRKRQRLINISIFITLLAIAALSIPLATQKVLATEQSLKWEARI